MSSQPYVNDNVRTYIRMCGTKCSQKMEKKGNKNKSIARWDFDDKDTALPWVCTKNKYISMYLSYLTEQQCQMSDTALP